MAREGELVIYSRIVLNTEQMITEVPEYCFGPTHTKITLKTKVLSHLLFLEPDSLRVTNLGTVVLINSSVSFV